MTLVTVFSTVFTSVPMLMVSVKLLTPVSPILKESVILFVALSNAFRDFVADLKSNPWLFLLPPNNLPTALTPALTALEPTAFVTVEPMVFFPVFPFPFFPVKPPNMEVVICADHFCVN